MLLMRACANGLRTRPTHSIPGRLMLSTYFARPVISSGSSFRSCRVPMTFVVRSVTAISPPLRVCRGLHGLDDVVIAGAAAEVALEPVADLVVRRVRMLLQEARRRHDHPGRAVAALQRVVLLERALHRVQLAVRRETLDRRDLVAVRLDGEQRARLHRLAVEMDGASTAGRRVAADVRAGEVQLLAQRVDEELPGLDLELSANAVDGDRDVSHCEPFSRGLGREANRRATAPRTA